MPIEARMTTTEGKIGGRLKEFGTTPKCTSSWPELDPETENLVRKNPFAFLVAVAFDRGMPWQKAWQIPKEIDRKGCLDPERLKSMPEAGLIELLDSLPIRHRWGARQGARTLSDAARLVCEQFEGDAGAIWRNSSPAGVEKTLQEIHGLGAGIAAMATRILHDEFNCFKEQERQIDVKPDSLLLRVFRQAGLIEKESAKEAKRVARRLSPGFPGALDRPAWRIGQLWCHASELQCAPCPLTEVCAKRI